MLRITFDELMLIHDDRWSITKTLHISKPLPPAIKDIPTYRGWFSKVVSVVATGQELDWIRQRFTGIPMYRNAKSMVWYGDIAVTILLNLDWDEE